MKANTILDTIGNTPHLRMQRLFGATHQVWIKSERANPGRSIKDRIALSMVEAAEKGGSVLGFNYDTGERYLSVEGFLPAE